MPKQQNPRDTIITLPNATLRKNSQRVGFVNQDTKDLVDRMKLATLDWEDNRQHEVGVALAAPQIAELLKIVIVRDNFEDKKNRNFITLINPVITKYEGKLVVDYEGCLSVTDIYGRVPRYQKVRVKALDLNGKEFRFTAEDFMARVIQHEIDHTKGTLFIDHIRDDPTAFYKLDKNGELQKLDYQKNIEHNPDLFE